ncbi:MAG: glycoside hydrolase family 125 protein [Opitutae bacterium]|nr:glycoside hydrolase family 125 protein [Opitutae bacterium]
MLLRRAFIAASLLGAFFALAAAEPRRFAIDLKPADVIPTGNDLIALPTIRAEDGALDSFNVLSMRDRGLLEVVGDAGAPALQPYFEIDGKPLPFRAPSWALIEYWIPTARLASDGLERTLTYCVPTGSRAALVRLTLTNRRAQPVEAALGVRASWGKLNRVTYAPVALRGERLSSPGETSVFTFVTHDTHFAWALNAPGARVRAPVLPGSEAPGVEASRTFKVAPGASVETTFFLSVGLEENSAIHAARVLRENTERHGVDGVIAQAAAWCAARTGSTGHADLDLLMNRNLLFTALYAWGRTLDTEQLVGVTSRSPRYYVSAAYWDRDAMLWSLPGLLDIDRALAREALDYALTIQLRNTGTHSRYIDGMVLEDGFQLDEAVAPLLALGRYWRETDDRAFLVEHRAAIVQLRDRLLGRFDGATGLYSSLQDAEDEFQKLPFITYDNALAWQALNDLAALFAALRDERAAADAAERAAALKAAILRHCVAVPPDATEPIFVGATDGKARVFTEVPPGSLMKLPLVGFVTEDDPVFARTYDWLHSPAYAFSYSDQPFGLPGSHRVPFTTSWSVADHLRLKRSREHALKIMRASGWDGGIVTEGIDPRTAKMDRAGRAFATAAGYVADALWQEFVVPAQPKASSQ